MDGLHELSFELANELRGAPPVAVPASPADRLVAQVRAGNLDAFGELMTLTEQLVLAVAWRVLGDRDQARDAAQETFLRVYRSLDRFRLGESFQAWICQITVNVCRDLARKRGPVAVELEVLEHHGGGAAWACPEAEALQVERRAMIQQALRTLPEGERTALVLRDIEGFATEDVARVLGVRPVTVRSQVASARAKLRAYCDRHLQRTSGGTP